MAELDWAMRNAGFLVVCNGIRPPSKTAPNPSLHNPEFLPVLVHGVGNGAQGSHGHHQIECPTCHLTERLDLASITAVMKWARENNSFWTWGQYRRLAAALGEIDQILRIAGIRVNPQDESGTDVTS